MDQYSPSTYLITGSIIYYNVKSLVDIIYIILAGPANVVLHDIIVDVKFTNIIQDSPILSYTPRFKIVL